MKAYRGVILAFTVFVALGLYAYFFEYRREMIENQRRAEETKLIGFDADAISEIYLESSDQQYGLVQQGDQSWVLKSGEKELEVDLSRVQELVKQLATQSYNVEVASGPDTNWALFGLKQPRVTLRVKSASQDERQVLISAKSNFEGHVYLRPQDREQVVLGNPIWDKIAARPAFYYRKKDVFELAPGELTKIELRQKGEVLTLIKEAEVWKSSAHPDWELDQSRISEFLLDLKGIQANSIELEGSPSPEQQRRLGLDEPKLSLQVESSAGTSWTGRLAEPTAGEYLLWSSEPQLVFGLQGMDAAKLLDFKMGELRNKMALEVKEN